MQALQSQLEFQEQSMVEKSLVSRQEAKIRELESKLEFEKTQVKRLEVRAKDRCRSAGGAGRQPSSMWKEWEKVGGWNVLPGSESEQRNQKRSW